MAKPVLIGTVLYEPKVTVIWDIIRDFFEEHGCPIDVIFYTDYELQVKALLKGHIDIAWNSPLAWLDSQRRSDGKCRAIAMRDSDRDRVSHLIVRKGSGLKKLEDLRGKTVAVGAKDSPQATLIPIGFLQRHNLVAGRDYQVRRFDVLLGKHGDHIGGELEAFNCLKRGEAEASTMLDLNWEQWTRSGVINLDDYAILGSTEQFDHCVFTVRNDFPMEVEKRWLKVLFSMSYENPEHQEMMDLEGLKQWMSGRTNGFGPLGEAIERQCYFQGVRS